MNIPANKFKQLIIPFIFLIIIVFDSNSILSQEEKTGSIAVTVTEKESGEYVISTNVYVYNTRDYQNSKPISGGKTNKFGFASIPKLKYGRYYLVVKSVFYKENLQEVNLNESTDLIKIELEQKSVVSQEAVVTADKPEEASTKISTIDIKPEFIAKMPSIGGEVDVFRVLQLLPGVKQNSELSSGLYVRGGSPDQNLTLLDGVVVYNPTHLGGFLSTFNSDALRDIQLIKGAYPAQYGGRLSSVLDMTMKEGNKDKVSGSAGISLITSKLTVEGPINDNSTFMVSGRRMYLDLLTGLMSAGTDTETPDYYFYDFNAKMNYKLSDKDRLFVSGYLGSDVFDFSQSENEEGFGMDWGNRTANIRWMHIVNPELFTNFSLIYTNYNFNSILTDDKGKTIFGTKNQINDFMLRAEAENYIDSSHTLKYGLEVTSHRFTTSSINDLFNEIPDEILESLGLKESLRSVIEAGLYFQDEWKVSQDLFLNLGSRLVYFDKGNYFRFEPRINSIYKLDNTSNIKGSVALVNQFLHLVIRNDINLPTDLWMPSSNNLAPSRSWQGVIGYEKTFLDGEYLFTAETYYRTMENIYEYKDSASFTFGIPLENQFTSGRGEGYGIELFLNKRAGDFQGWIGYTLAKTTRTFTELNNGKSFSPRFDTRHDLSLVLTYNLADNLELGATWIYTTGQAYTMPTGSYSGFGNVDGGQTGQNSRNPNLIPEYSWGSNYNFSDRNAYRLPAFHKMDLNFMYKFEFFELPAIFSINIYNVYNRRNAFAMYLDEETNISGETTKKVKLLTLFPIIPTLGFSFKF